MDKRESMKSKKIKRRLKRVRNNNRKTVGEGWDTQKTVRQGITKRKRDGIPIKFPFLDMFRRDKDELEKRVKRIKGKKGR